ncbi:hypothetical protein SAMD00024442_1_47 [Candidatus Symbiothrix dinenymphae]|nr:hypothetical protein SAMD00024442_1_47 [Candidatus Symbiothrix dinenymphae]
MKIELKEITVRELTAGYEDNRENGVVGYGKFLDIRPPYQREFIYKDKQRDAVYSGSWVTATFPTYRREIGEINSLFHARKTKHRI